MIFFPDKKQNKWKNSNTHFIHLKVSNIVLRTTFKRRENPSLIDYHDWINWIDKLSSEDNIIWFSFTLFMLAFYVVTFLGSNSDYILFKDSYSSYYLTNIVNINFLSLNFYFQKLHSAYLSRIYKFNWSYLLKLLWFIEFCPETLKQFFSVFWSWCQTKKTWLLPVGVLC